MKILLATFFCAAGIVNCAFAQQALYDITAANGNGIRFWQSDFYKMHMGNLPEYKYGPVSDYSIKVNMHDTPGRGWTWGIGGQVPVAALGNTGEMQLARSLYLGPVFTPVPSIGRISISGSSSEISISNRQLSSFVASPLNGERWVIYNAGTATDGKLRIWSNGDKMVFTKEGYVGIGTETPAHHLDVNGIIKAAGLASSDVGIGAVSPFTDARLRVKAPTASPWAIVAEASANQKIIGLSHNGTAGFISTGSAGSDGASPIHFQTSGAVRMSILETGNVSIGTPLASNPNNYLFAVNGKIGAKEVRVEKTSATWPDYVFEPGYELPDLKAVEAFIAANKHLQEVPSAKEVEATGHDLGTMDAVLLKKVEELTLYIIEQDKKISALQEAMKQLQEK